jgi:small subunit ribosomal protein S1
MGSEIVLSRRLALGAAAREQVEAAYRAGLPVEGRVEGLNKGGYEVRVAGLRAFCPMGQIDVVRTEDPGQHVGRVYPFRIIELREGGRNLVVSRRAILEEEAREKAREVMRSVVPGAVLAGRVASVTPYGAFVDLGGGVQGLLHVSELGWTRVASPEEVVQTGQTLAVQVVKVEDRGRKISLSLRHLQADPWLKVGSAYSVGQTLQCCVTRLADFGAFVELEPGIEALAHQSSFPPSERDWKALVPAGSTATFRIESIDVEQRKIGVAWRDAPPDAAPSTSPEGLAAAAGGAPASQPGQRLGSLADKLRAAMEPGRRKP